MTPNPVAAIIQTLEEEEREKYRDRERPLEDEELVGREAAEKARQERIGWGREVLIREDRRWDWLLGEIVTLAILFILTDDIQIK
jgi:cytochrome c-type biogenesis protein CcmH/NrfG